MRFKTIIVTVALVLGAATAIACGGSPSSDGKPVAVGSAPEASKPAAGKVPAAKDFKIKLKVLKKECFDTAGCVITYRVNAVSVPAGLDAGTTYEVTYKITGAKDPIEGTVSIKDSKFDSNSIGDEITQTARKTDTLVATATAVEVV